jgi:Pin2-interacting protein X1
LFTEKTSFGSRMLNKMGWSEGKGLGVQLQGDPEFVRIKYKCDADGLGYEDRNDQWTKHEDGFSQLLNNLNNASASDAPKPIQSLEEKSKNSRVRVHYMKFTKGKDLSKRSAKELANIFGKASLTVEPKAEKIADEEETV